jgi:hypothetical protein
VAFRQRFRQVNPVTYQASGCEAAVFVQNVEALTQIPGIWITEALSIWRMRWKLLILHHTILWIRG